MTHQDLEDKITVFAGHSIFETMSRQDLAPLAELSRWQTFKRGDTIFSQGDAPHHAHIVHTGRVKVFRMSATGHSFTMIVAGPSNTINAVACFGFKPRMFSAKAIEVSSVLAIPAEEFVKFVIHHPSSAERVVTTMGMHLSSAFNRIMDLIEEGVEQRILNVLRLLSERLGQSLPLTNTDLAELAGTTRETTARMISRLDETGILIKKRGRIEIVSPDRLYELASDRYFFI